MRLFIGIPLPGSVEAELTATCRRLRSENDGLRWSAPESWHITLEFLGNATAEQFDCLAAHLAEVRSAPVPVRLGKLGVFDRAGVFLAEVELTPKLVELQRRVTAATAGCGFATDGRPRERDWERPWHPHITLARAKGEAGRRALKALKISTPPGHIAFPHFVAEEFLLYESHLGPAGSKYEVRQRIPLAAKS